MKKNFLISLAIVIFLISPFIIELLISIESPYGFINENNKSAYIGLYSAILGGSITLIGVLWTIKNQVELIKNDNVTRNNERKDEDRKKYMPYFTISDYSYIPQVDDLLDLQIPCEPNFINTIIPELDGDIYSYHSGTADFIFHFKNSGRGEAMEVKLSKLSTSNIKIRLNGDIIQDEKIDLKKINTVSKIPVNYYFVPPENIVKLSVYLFNYGVKNKNGFIKSHDYIESQNKYEFEFFDFIGNKYNQKIDISFIECAEKDYEPIIEIKNYSPVLVK